MDFWYFYLLPLIGGLFLYALQSAAVRAPGVALQKKFISLGTLRGRTLQSIVAGCGQPNSFSSLANGRSVRQWMATGYHISLIFNGDTCEGVSHEAKV